MTINGKRKYVYAGADYQAAKLLAQEAKQKKTQFKALQELTEVDDELGIALAE